MNIFNYNSSTINYYTTQDLGSIGDTPASIVDNGIAYSELEPSTDFIVENDYIVSDFTIEPDYGFIVFTETTYPFGGFNISNATKVSASVKFVAAPQIKLYGTYKVKLRSAWVGSGTLFEIGGGKERIVAPWVGSSGPLRVSGTAASAAVYQYNNSSIAVFSSGDYGSVLSAHTTSSNYGQITAVTSGEIDQGSIVIPDITYPYGLFSFSGNFSNLTRTFGHQSSGIIAVSGSASVVFNEPTPQIYLVTTKDNIRINGSANQAFVRKTYDGLINFELFDKGIEHILFTYNESSISYFVNSDLGSVTASGSANNYGSIIDPATGEIIYGYTFDTQTLYPYGSILSQGGFSNLLRSFGHRSQGLISVSGSASTALQEPTPQIYKIQSTDLFKTSGTANHKFTKATYNGFGSLYSFNGFTENVTFDYNTSSVSVYNETNYGSLGSSSVTEDYGSVTQNNIGEITYGEITSSQTNYPFGSLSISGNKVEKFIHGRYIGTGNIFAFKGSAQSKQIDYEATYLFKLQGNGANSFTRPFIGSGSLFRVGDRVERRTYDYNTSSVNQYSEFDYGLVTASGYTVDYGLLNQVVDQGEISYGFIDTRLTEYSTNLLFTFTGDVVVQYRPTFSQRGSGGFKIHHQPAPTDTKFIPWWRGYGEFVVSNRIIPDAFSRPYIGQGRLFSVGDKIESVTYDYSSSSIEFFSPEDYGNVTSSGTTIDLGYVNQDNTGVIDYSSIVNLDIEYPLNVLYNVTGECVAQFIRGPYIGRGRIKFDGFNTIRQSDKWDGVINVSITGSAIQKNTENYVGSGSLFNIGDRVERATYSYNSSSVSGYDELNYGLVTTSGSSLDYGQITQISSGGEIDYGNVIDLDITYPYGLFKINGISDNRWIQVFTKVGSGSLFEFKGATEAFSAQTPENTFLYNISGIGHESKTNRFIGSGSLFNIGDRIERTTYSYNTSSIVAYGPDVDYGSVTASGSTVDYGLINQVITDGEVDYGSIILYDYDYPVNVLFKFTGESLYEYKPSFTFNGQGTINIKSDLTFARFLPWWRGYGELFVSGTANQSESRIYIASGSLFHIGDRVERATYSYNSSSVSGYDELDYGLVTASGTTVDNGYVNQTAVDGEIDYGNVIDLDITYPFGLFKINGASDNRWIQVFTKVGSGSLFEFKGATEAFSAQTPENTFLYNVSGNANSVRNKTFIGSGSLFNIGDRIERAAFSYNTSSIVDASTSIDYGDLNTPTQNIDNGSIINVTDGGEIDYGYITITSDGEVPFGLFRVYGAASTPFRRHYDGSGTLSTYTGAAEVFSAQTPENTFLYAFSGSAGTPRTKSFIASGDALSITGYITEKNTESYVGSGDLTFEQIYITASEVHVESYSGRGNITLSTGRLPEFRNYRPSPRYVNSIYGNIGGELIVSGDATTKPIAVFTKIGSGTEFISGSKIESQTDFWNGTGNINVIGDSDADRTRAYSGTGTFSILKGSAEAFSAQTPENTFLYNVSGNANDSRSKIFIGSGSVFSVGSSTVIRLISAPQNTVLFNVYGTAVPVITLSHYGSGSLFSYRESRSSVTFNPVENTALYQISGSGTFKKSDKHNGSGQIDITGTLGERNTENYLGTGNIFAVGESNSAVVFNPVENIQLFNVYGSAVESHTERYIGTGSAEISGIAIEKNTENYVGTGTLLSFAQSESKVSFNPPEETVLFKFAGSAVEKNTENYVGSGSLFAFNSSSESATIVVPSEIQLFSFSGSAIEKNTERYIGTGNIFTIGTKVESRTVFERSSGNINITGYIEEKYSKAPYQGSGSLFTFKGATESKTSNPLEETVLFKFTGSAVEKNTENYVGSGSTRISGNVTARFTKSYVGKGNISFANNAVIISFVAQTPENTILFKFSGESRFRHISRYLGSGTEFISGAVTEKQTDSYRGKGSLFGIGNASASRLVAEKADTRTSLFKISGGERNNYSRISITNKFNIEISGTSRDVVVLFTPIRIFGTII
jgi:hypothetical protein